MPKRPNYSNVRIEEPIEEDDYENVDSYMPRGARY